MPFPKKWENLPAETTPISAEALKDLEERTSPAISALNYTGVDATGATDSTTGLLKAIEDAWSQQKKLIVPFGTYKIGAAGTGLDLSTLPWPKATKWEVEPWKAHGTTRIIGFQMDASEAIFVANSALGKNPCINISPPAGYIFLWEADIRIGHVEGAAATEAIGVRFRSLSNSKLLVFGVEGGTTGFAGSGIQIDQRTAKVYFGNNECTFFQIFNTKGNGIETLSDTVAEAEAHGAPSAEISGNVFNVGVAGGNTNWGIATDAAVGRQTHGNTWRVQAPESNTSGGILDHGGTLGQLWYIGIGNANVSGIDYELAAGSVGHAPIIAGSCEGSISLNGQNAIVLDAWRNQILSTTVNAVAQLTINNRLIRFRPANTEIKGTVNNLEVTGYGKNPPNYVPLEGNTTPILTGLESASVVEGQRVAFTNVGTVPIPLPNNNTGSFAVNRFYNVGKTTVVLAPRASVEYEYGLAEAGGIAGWLQVNQSAFVGSSIPTVTKTNGIVSYGGIGTPRSRQQVLFAKAAEATTKVKHELESKSINAVKAWKLEGGEAGTEVKITSFAVNTANEITITWEAALSEKTETLIGVAVF